MKTLTLTTAALIVFFLANTNSGVDMPSSESVPPIAETAAGESPIATAPPAPQTISAAPSSRRGNSRRVVQQSAPGLYESLGTSGPQTERVHVIPTADITAEDLEKITEDMNIMCHLLHQELQPKYDSRTRYTRSRYGTGYSRPGTGHSTWDLATVLGVESQNTQGIYLEGFGAIFLIKVNFPLSAPPETDAEQREPKEVIDSAWEQAKQDLYQSGETTRTVETLSPDKYDMYKVDYLKEKLITALKYAANIRKLEPDDTVVVTVKGRPTTKDSANVLTLRTKKSDVDAYSQGDLDADAFHQKVKILVY